MKTVIVGGGPAGLMAALNCRTKGEDVIVIEKNDSVGKKILLTGNGRCNLTSLQSVPDFLNHVIRNPSFLKTALYHFSPQNTVNYFENLGVKTKVEDKHRVFPVSDKASEIVGVLLNEAIKNGVEFLYRHHVEEIEKSDSSFIIKTSVETILADKVVIATGGKSYSMTGSTGDGYYFAAKLGHTIVPIRPALCPIVLSDEFVSDLEGLSLKDIRLKAKHDGKEKVLSGDIIFTNSGISGPIVIWMSSFINRAEKITLCLDIKPNLSFDALDDLLVQKFLVNKNKAIISVMTAFAPKNMAKIILEKSKIALTKMVNEITKAERHTIANLFKTFPLTYKSLAPLEAGFVTSGGVDVKEIDPRTMESKIVKGLYFAGEIIDVDALSGGFSLTIAFATGKLVGG